MKVPSLTNRRLYIFVIAALLVVTAIFGYNFFMNGNAYNYKTVGLYRLDSRFSGAALSVQKPAEINQKARSVAVGSSLAYLAQDDPGQSAQNKLAYIGLSTTQDANVANKEYMEYLSGVLNKPSDRDYPQAVTPIKDFIRNATDGRGIVDLKNAKQFRSADIKENAWSFDFKARSSDINIREIEGRAVLAAGNRTFYYVLVAAPDGNWGGNQKAWTQVLDSLKINQ